jgi:hypothetical protein
MSPPKKERRLCWTALQKLRLDTAYHVAVLLANTFGLPFWLAEQWRGKLADRIENQRRGE